MHERNTVGLDLGDRYSEFCVLDASNTVVARDRVLTTRKGIRRRFAGMPKALIALEVCVHSPWVSRELSALGHEVVVAHAAKIPMIYQSVRKNDRTDAEMLARLARVDPKLLAPVTHRGERAQQDLQLIRARDALVETRTKLINHVRSVVKVHGERLPKCSTESFVKAVQHDIPEALQPALAPVLETIAGLTASIKGYDKSIEAVSEQSYPETTVLRQVAGVGPVTALAFVLTLERPERFVKSRDVGPYLGLVPKQRQSGQSQPHLRITKAGNRFLRRLLVGSAQYILGHFGPDTALRRWGLNKAAGGGRNAKKRAVVAVARKLAVLLHRLWTTGEVYEPFPTRAGG
jgi:transposase